MLFPSSSPSSLQLFALVAYFSRGRGNNQMLPRAAAWRSAGQGGQGMAAAAAALVLVRVHAPHKVHAGRLGCSCAGPQLRTPCSCSHIQRGRAARRRGRGAGAVVHDGGGGCVSPRGRRRRRRAGVCGQRGPRRCFGWGLSGRSTSRPVSESQLWAFCFWQVIFGAQCGSYALCYAGASLKVHQSMLVPQAARLRRL